MNDTKSLPVLTWQERLKLDPDSALFTINAQPFMLAEIADLRAAIAAPAAPSEQARPTVKQLAAQLDDDKPWTRAEQDAFAVFLARFPNESSQGIISLGDAWKAGRQFEAAAAPAAPLPAQPERAAWEYSFIHSSATGRVDSKIGPCLTYDRSIAFGVGCIEQREVSVTEPAGRILIDRYEEMRRALVIQIDNLLDIAERHAWKKDDDEELARTEGAIAHARKVVDPYRYNGNGPMPTTTCGACDGTGNYSTAPDSGTCEECDGTGKIDPTTEEWQ